MNTTDRWAVIVWLLNGLEVGRKPETGRKFNSEQDAREFAASIIQHGVRSGDKYYPAHRIAYAEVAALNA